MNAPVAPRKPMSGIESARSEKIPLLPQKGLNRRFEPFEILNEMTIISLINSNISEITRKKVSYHRSDKYRNINKRYPWLIINIKFFH